MSDKKVIDVEMAQMAVAGSDTILKTSGVGSCIVITIYDSISKVGGMAHAMLASAKSKTHFGDTVATAREGINEGNLDAKYADQAVEKLVAELEKLGGKKQNFKAKLIGGARMFKLLSGDKFGIGYQNTESAKHKLEELGIFIESEDTGGTIGRSVEFNLENGLVSVNTKM